MEESTARTPAFRLWRAEIGSRPLSQDDLTGVSSRGHGLVNTRSDTLPEGGPLVEQVRDDGEGDEGEDDTDQGPGHHVHGVVEVVADPGEADPE